MELPAVALLIDALLVPGVLLGIVLPVSSCCSAAPSCCSSSRSWEHSCCLASCFSGGAATSGRACHQGTAAVYKPWYYADMQQSSCRISSCEPTATAQQLYA